MIRVPHLVVVVLLCACSAEPAGREAVAKGWVDLSWMVPGGCDDAGLAEVDVLLGGDHVGSHACSEGAVVFRARAGLHMLQLGGVDRFGQDRYAAEVALQVVEGETTPVPTLVLEALPAEVEVSWFFANSRLCSTNEVVSVDVAVFEEGSRVADVDADCDQGIAVLRELPSGRYLLDVVGRDVVGRAQYHGEREIDVDKGQVVAVEVELSAM